MTSVPTADDISIPALLRAARGSYALAIGEALAQEGFDGMPRNGPFVLGGVAKHGASVSGMVRGLGITKQAASQLVDTLVLRGYLSREVNPNDRRRMTIELTERGRGAAEVIGAAIAKVDAELARMLTPAELAGLRKGLLALAEIRERRATHD